MGVFDLTGRTALITGAAQGLGAGIADAFARAGAAVMVADIQEDAGRATAETIAKHGVAAGFVKLDVTREADWEIAVTQTIEGLGGFDVLVNNAGIELSALIIDADVDALHRMFDVNVIGTSLGLKHAFRSMRPGGPVGRGGSVVNISSVAATIAFPGISGYSATKSAVDRLTRVAAMESGKLGYGVRVNCLYPGLVPTAMGMKLAVDMAELGLWPSAEAAVGDVIGLTPLGRLGEVTDMADAAVFLASDASRFVTGTGLAVDGGMGM
jgi:3alpha(or 20beta)-hydroxysteroid dehydrogenase